jgi:hypothetical protein
MRSCKRRENGLMKLLEVERKKLDVRVIESFDPTGGCCLLARFFRRLYENALLGTNLLDSLRSLLKCTFYAYFLMPLIKLHELKIKFEVQVEKLEVDKMTNRQNGQN